MDGGLQIFPCHIDVKSINDGKEPVDLICDDNARVVVDSGVVPPRNQSKLNACWAGRKAVDQVNLFISRIPMTTIYTRSNIIKDSTQEDD
jgi:hypothetical protein